MMTIDDLTGRGIHSAPKAQLQTICDKPARSRAADIGSSMKSAQTALRFRLSPTLPIVDPSSGVITDMQNALDLAFGLD
jgi:hypothetical protein